MTSGNLMCTGCGSRKRFNQRGTNSSAPASVTSCTERTGADAGVDEPVAATQSSAVGSDPNEARPPKVSDLLAAWRAADRASERAREAREAAARAAAAARATADAIAESAHGADEAYEAALRARDIAARVAKDALAISDGATHDLADADRLLTDALSEGEMARADYQAAEDATRLRYSEGGK